MSVLLVGVGWSYEIICRLFPDGGGVYSSARHRSQILAVIGGLLLCADYVVTASLSCLDAFHYLEAALGFHGLQVMGVPIEAVLAAATILAIGAMNYFGPTKTGTMAMYIALATVALTLIIGVRAALHLLGLSPIPGVGSVHLASPFSRGLWDSWVGFTEIVLALSGVEAIANMTGIMVPPGREDRAEGDRAGLDRDRGAEPAAGGGHERAARLGAPDPRRKVGAHRRHAQGDRLVLRRPGLREVQLGGLRPALALGRQHGAGRSGLDPVHALARQGATARLRRAEPVRNAALAPR